MLNQEERKPIDLLEREKSLTPGYGIQSSICELCNKQINEIFCCDCIQPASKAVIKYWHGHE